MLLLSSFVALLSTVAAAPGFSDKQKALAGSAQVSYGVNIIGGSVLTSSPVGPHCTLADRSLANCSLADRTCKLHINRMTTPTQIDASKWQ